MFRWKKLKDRLAQNVRNEKKIAMLADQLSKTMQAVKNLNQIATQFQAKIDTSRLTFGGYNNSAIGRESEIVGELFTYKTGELIGPLKGKFGPM